MENRIYHNADTNQRRNNLNGNSNKNILCTCTVLLYISKFGSISNNNLTLNVWVFDTLHHHTSALEFFRRILLIISRDSLFCTAVRIRHFRISCVTICHLITSCQIEWNSASSYDFKCANYFPFKGVSNTLFPHWNSMEIFSINFNVYKMRKEFINMHIKFKANRINRQLID